MTLQEAMDARSITPNRLVELSGLSRTTVDNTLGRRGTKHKTGVKTRTLLAIAKALDATIIVDASMPDYYNVILKEVDKDEDDKGNSARRAGHRAGGRRRRRR